MITHDTENFEFRYSNESGVSAGKLCYRYIKDDVIDVYTTKVELAFQGKGIAAELFRALIAFAEEKKLKIKPSCSYIEAKMRKNHQDRIVY